MAAGQANRFVAQAGGRRNLDTSVAVVGGKAEYTPYGVKRMAGGAPSWAPPMVFRRARCLPARRGNRAGPEDWCPCRPSTQSSRLNEGLARSGAGPGSASPTGGSGLPDGLGASAAVLRPCTSRQARRTIFTNSLRFSAVRVKPALHLLKGFPGGLPGSGQTSGCRHDRASP